MALNKQEVFNKVALHLLKQGVRSQSDYDDTGSFGCAYRGDNGTSCAVGCLIPDELYHPDMENSTASSVLAMFPKTQSLFTEDVKEGYFLTYLQRIHDGENFQFWFDHLWQFAEREQLSTAVLFEKDTV